MRWTIPRTLAIVALLFGGFAVAGSLFKKKSGDDEPTADPPPAEAEAVAAPPAPTAPPLFEGALPVPVQKVPEGLANLSAQGCNACHFDAHDAWAASGHAGAWGDDALQDAMDRAGGATACRSCHLPLTSQHARVAAGYIEGDLARPDLKLNPGWDPTLTTEGVTCAACHVRDGVVVATRAAPGAPHPVAVSTELGSPELCAACHQLTWPEADKPFYDTYGEWKATAYAEAGVGCVDCHMPLKAGLATATRFAASPSHRFDADLRRGLSVLLDLAKPEVQRGELFEVTVHLQNTGAGHHVPTGSPFKVVRVSVELLDADGEELASAGTLELGRTVADGPPWRTLSDTRIPAGGELKFRHQFEVAQRAAAQRAQLRVVARRVVGQTVSEPLVLRTMPIPVL